VTDDYCMSSSALRRAALAVAAVAAAGMAAVAAAPAAVAHPIGQLSEPDALFMPVPSKVPALTGGVTAAATVGAASTTLSSSSYKFSSLLDGQPVRWNPCQAIHWRANISRGPVGGLDVLKAAVAHISATTGTTWVYDGTTLSVPSTAYLPKTPTNTNKPVLIGWTDGASSDLLAGRPAQVLGMTRTTWFGVDDGMGHRAAATRAAVVALDRTNHLPLRGVQSWSATALHELGHVMGLDHPADSRQLMAATLPNAATYQAGDDTGLVRLGRSAGCVVIPGT
jgi:hypothetical protein